MRYPRACPSCGAENRNIAKVCDQCGAQLNAVPEAPAVPSDWNADLDRPRVRAARLLIHAYSVTYRLAEHRLRPAGVSPVQFRALTLVRLLPPPTTPSTLALQLALDSRTVSDLVSRLEQSGWVRRVRDLPDRRAVRLELTEIGEKLLAEAWSPAMAAYEEGWGEIPIRDLNCVLRTLRKVRDSTLEKLGYRPEEIYSIGPSPEEALEEPAAERL